MRFPFFEPRHKKHEGGGHVQDKENDKTYDYSGCDRILYR